MKHADLRPPEHSMMTVRDVAALCQLSERAVYRAIESGELPGTRLRSRLRIRSADVATWIEAGAVGQPTVVEGHTRTRVSKPEPARSDFRALVEASQESLWISASE